MFRFVLPEAGRIIGVSHTADMDDLLRQIIHIICWRSRSFSKIVPRFWAANGSLRTWAAVPARPRSLLEAY